MRKPAQFVTTILMLLLFTTPICAQQNRKVVYAQNDTSKKEQTTNTTTKSDARMTNDDSYVIGAGDVLKLDTWKEPDFSVESLLVRNDGMITCPLVGDVQAAGLTPTQLTKNLEHELKKYIATPVVTITVLNPQSQVFYILGEVRNTGSFPLLKELTVLQAFALAGGFTEWAAKGDIVVLRKENGKTKQYSVNYKRIARGKDLNKNIIIKANDTIIVP